MSTSALPALPRLPRFSVGDVEFGRRTLPRGATQTIAGRIVDGEPRVVIGIEGYRGSHLVIGVRDLGVVAQACADARRRAHGSFSLARSAKGVRVCVRVEPLADGTTRLVFVRTVDVGPIGAWVMLDEPMIGALDRGLAWLADAGSR